jgi:hypothetical protein
MIAVRGGHEAAAHARLEIVLTYHTKSH